MVHNAQGIVAPVLGTIVAVKVIDVLGQTIKATSPRKRKKKRSKRR